MSDALLSKQRKKVLEKFADHPLKESYPHCQHIVRQALIVQDNETHCKNAVNGLEGNHVCGECGEMSK
jgi:hypothetical protein